MAEVLRGQTGVVVLGKVVGSVAVAQAVVRPIPANGLFGFDPLPLEVWHLLKRAFAPLDMIDPLDEVGRERLDDAGLVVLGKFLGNSDRLRRDVLVDHVWCFPLGSQPAKNAEASVGRQRWLLGLAVGQKLFDLDGSENLEFPATALGFHDLLALGLAWHCGDAWVDLAVALLLAPTEEAAQVGQAVPANSPQAHREEKTYFQALDVLVTNKRVVHGGKTYALKQITSVGRIDDRSGPKTIYGINIGQSALWCWFGWIISVLFVSLNFFFKID